MSRRNQRKATNRSIETNKAKPRYEVSPKTRNQEIYINSMINNSITFCSGPAGTGKSSVSVGVAVKLLLDSAYNIDKIVITRPVIEARGASQGLGYIPGTKEDKMRPYLMPIFDELHKYLGVNETQKMIGIGKIEICPLEFMRGRTFNNSFMILDEAQNCMYDQIKLFVTRLGMQSKAVINGDPTQSDLYFEKRGGFEEIISKVHGVHGVSVCMLDQTDIVRNPIISKLLERI